MYGAQNSRGLLFFEGLFLAFRCLFSSLFVFPQEHKMMASGRSGLAWHRVVPAGSRALLAGRLARPVASSREFLLDLTTSLLRRCHYVVARCLQLKERSSGMYRLSAFYLARTASDIPSDLSIPSLFIVIICESAAPRFQERLLSTASCMRPCSHSVFVSSLALLTPASWGPCLPLLQTSWAACGTAATSSLTGSLCC